MSDHLAFRAGFASRTTAPAHLLDIAFAPAPPGFAPRQVYPPKGEAGPKHFHPADREPNPTQGWDMRDPAPVAESFVDPIEAAHDAGFAQGHATACAELTEGAARDRALIEARMAARRAHFMPVALLDSQFATLEPPAVAEHPLVMPIDAPPDVLAKRIAGRIGAEGTNRDGGVG